MLVGVCCANVTMSTPLPLDAVQHVFIRSLQQVLKKSNNKNYGIAMENIAT